MEVANATFQRLLVNSNQYLVPLFQRQYSWNRQNWETLWQDLLAWVDSGQREPHFMGSLVCAQAISVPQGVPKFLIIDGQQRTTTIMILLAAIRDRALQSADPQERLKGEEINDTILINRYGQGLDRFKLLPTQPDRPAYYRVMEREPVSQQGVGAHLIEQAHQYFDRKVKLARLPLLQLADAVLTGLSVVSITLGEADNPYAVFESLNAKGQPLSQGDLVRNYVFMGIHRDRQQELYEAQWLPMQTRLGELNISEFIRHYLVRQGGKPASGEVFQSFRAAYREADIEEGLQTLSAASVHYAHLLHGNPALPSQERQLLNWVRRGEMAVFYPVLIALDEQVRTGRTDEADYWRVAGAILNYNLRRFACSQPTNSYRGLVDSITKHLKDQSGTSGTLGCIRLLAEAGYPSDAYFAEELSKVRLYDGGRKNKTRVILEMLEASYGHRESARIETATIEHIMPQTLSQEWHIDLGEAAGQIHETLVNTLGNLTLSAYNGEMSNGPFSAKRDRLANSHYELNRSLAILNTWSAEEIKARSRELAQQALVALPHIMPELVDRTPEAQTVERVVGRTPTKVMLFGQMKEVSSWRDVIRHTLSAVAENEPEDLLKLHADFPYLIRTSMAGVLAPFQIPGTPYIAEVNGSADMLYNYCRQIMQVLGYEGEFDITYY